MSNLNDPFVHDQDGDAPFALGTSPGSRHSPNGSPQSPHIPSIARSILSESSVSSLGIPFSVTRTPPSPTVKLNPAFRESLPQVEASSAVALLSRSRTYDDGDERKESENDDPSNDSSFSLRRHRFTPEDSPEACHFAEDILHTTGALLMTPPSRVMLSSVQRAANTPYNSPELFHLDDDEHPEQETPEFVTKAMIQQWNNEIGNLQNVNKATKLIEKMRQLGGLDPSVEEESIDIPAARIGLCFLAGLNNQENKIHALTSLLEILKADNYNKANSVQLVKLAIQLLHLMNREVLQAVDIEAQSKIAEVYNVLAETLHHHYGKHHINALTEELKLQLILTAKSIERLNRLEEVELKFHAHCALEGVRRLKDDKKELFDIAERVYHLAVGAVQLYLDDSSGDGFLRLEQALSGLDPHLSNAWYDAILLLKRMARDVKEDAKKMTPLLMFIGQNYQKQNWKFTYAAIQVLFQLSLHGANAKVRLRAFNGIKQLGRDFPGLSSFVDCTDMKQYTSYKPMAHLERPQKIDPNVRIRHATIKCLHELLDNSTDEMIRDKAAFILRRRERLERDPHVMNAIQRKNSF